MWQEKNNELHKQFKFKDFKEAFAFMHEVAAEAEARRHHPRWHQSWDTIQIWLNTHEAGDVVTDKDRAFAEVIDAIYKSKNLAPQAFDYTPHAGVHKNIRLYADGGSRGNPGPSASGFVLLTTEGDVIKKSGVYLGITTNNQAEYQALKFGLEEARKLDAVQVDVFMDSLLVVNQMKGLFKVKNRDLWPIYEAIKELAKHFKKVTYTHVPRELNKLADGEVNETLDTEAAKVKTT